MALYMIVLLYYHPLLLSHLPILKNTNSTTGLHFLQFTQTLRGSRLK